MWQVGGGQKRCIKDFGGENLRQRDHLEDIRADGMKILTPKTLN